MMIDWRIIPSTSRPRYFKTQKRLFVCLGSREYRRDFVPVSQVIETHLAFLNIKQSGVFNVGTGRTRSFYEVAEQFGVPIEEIPMPEHLKQSYQTYTCADMTRTDRAIAS
jgi:ADP-L-glycero-D-manno-heptose 6-epimerase